MKVVLDTNVFISGLLWRGAPYRCLLAIRAGLADLVVSPPILEELRRVLMTKFHHTAAETEEVLAFVRESATLVEIPGRRRHIGSLKKIAAKQIDKLAESPDTGKPRLVVLIIEIGKRERAEIYSGVARRLGRSG